MFIRNYREGQSLDVAGLNKITVLFDRSLSDYTEVGLNEWRPGLDGPPHFHDEKDQVFFVTRGTGIVRLGGERHEVKPGSLAFIPAGLEHQTITTSEEPLCYLLLNIYESDEKKTFEQHIETVRATRKAQAETQSSGGVSMTVKRRPAKFYRDVRCNMKAGRTFDFGCYCSNLLIDRTESSRIEVTITKFLIGCESALETRDDMEQTFFVLKGAGEIRIGDERGTIEKGDVVFVPRSKPFSIKSDERDLVFLSLSTLTGQSKESTFAELHERMTWRGAVSPRT